MPLRLRYLMHTQHTQSIELDYNALSGTPPASWSAMSKLRDLAMPYNQFSGTLPVAEWKAGMSSLIYLNIRENRIITSSVAGPSFLAGWPKFSLW